MTHKDLWETGDMSLAVFLSMYVTLVNMEWRISKNRSSCYWLFKDTDQLHELIWQFNNDDALVSPKRFNENVGAMKRKMFAMREAS